MRLSALLYTLVALLMSNAGARAEDCKSLPAQSEQIACLQREIEQLRDEVEQLRSGIDDRIKRALTDLEPRVQPLSK